MPERPEPYFETKPHPIIDFRDLAQQYPDLPWLERIKRAFAQRQDIRFGDICLYLLHPDTDIRRDLAHFDQYNGPFVAIPLSTLEMVGMEQEREMSPLTVLAGAAGMARLSGIPTLSTLTPPEEDPRQYMDAGLDVFIHNRLEHSWIAAAVMEIVLMINQYEGRMGLSTKETLKGALAALLHDSATVAGGDAMRLADKEALSEEALINRILDREQVKATMSEMGLDERDAGDIKTIIANEGMLGRLLDLIDRISYTVRDAVAVCGNVTPEECSRPCVKQIDRIIRKDPQLTDIIFSIKVDPEGRVYVEDPARLERFLRLRAWLHVGLYLHPESQLMEAAVITPALKRRWEADSASGRADDESVTIENLLRWERHRLEDVLSREIGGTGQGFMVSLELARYAKANDIKVSEFPDRAAAAEGFIGTLRGRKALVTVDFTKGFDLALDTLVPAPGGLKPFAEVFPRKAAEIAKIGDAVKTVRVYHGIDR